MRPSSDVTREAVWWVVLAIAGILATFHFIGLVPDGGKLLKLVLIAAGGVAACWALRRPSVALYGTLIAAAFDQQITILGYLTGTVELALIAFSPAMLIAWRRGPSRRSVLVCGVLLVVGAIIATFNATQPGIAIWGAIRWVLVLNLILGGMAVIAANPQCELRRLAMCIANLGIVVGIFALLQRSGRYAIVGAPYQSAHTDSTFGYYTVYANFMAIAAIIAIGLLFVSWYNRDASAVVVATASSLISVYCVLFALSRGALLALGVGVLFLLLVRIRRPGTLVVSSILVTSVGATAYALTPLSTIETFRARFQTSEDNDSIRSSLQAAGRELLAAYPQGNGYLNFQDRVASGQVVARQALAHSHNLYIQMGLDVGWLGLASFLLIVVIALLTAIRSGRSSGGHAYQALFGAALAGYLAQGQYDYLLYEAASMIFLAALIMGATIQPGSSHELTRLRVNSIGNLTPYGESYRSGRQAN